jgi:hypothetical protein
MANTVVAYNLFTDGGELKKLDNTRYVGPYHILEDGTIMSGRSPDSTVPPPEMLLPVNFMPVNENNELISKVDPNTNKYQGVYSVITVKNYNNEVEFPQETTAPELAPPTITLHPDQFFRRDSALTYDAGREIFVDQNRNVTVALGTIIPLSINYVSSDTQDNITFEWFDSYDRVVSNNRDFVIDTGTVDWKEETFYCVITDSFGSETSNEVVITIIDPYNHPIIFDNILENGYGNDDTAGWQSIGQAPEEIGKFLPKFEISTSPNGTGLGLGTIHYHKFDLVTSSYAGSVYKNQWYPRPEAIDFYNGFNISTELQDNYFRAGQFFPVSGKQFDHAGTMKSSFQLVDLTEHETLLSGKVYGIRGFRAVLFGWLGSRGDQGDRCYAEFKFYDENDNEILIDTDTYKNKIESLTVWDRIINEARTEPDGTEHPPTVYQLGYNDSDFGFNYTGSFYDGNDVIELNSIKGRQTISKPNGLLQEIYEDAQCKTLIVGRMTDMIGMSNQVRKIKVIKYYFHEPGKYDLVNEPDRFKADGEDYMSDTMIAALNLRLYPILIDSSGSAIDTGIDDLTGLPVIKGFDMDRLEPNPGPNYIDDLEMQLDTIEWLNPDTSFTGLQLYTARPGNLKPVAGITNNKYQASTTPIITNDGYPNELPITGLGAGYTVVPNAIMFELYKRVLSPQAEIIGKVIYQYKLKQFNFKTANGSVLTTNLYDADGLGLLNYYTDTNPNSSYNGELWPDMDDDSIFR